MAEKFGMEKPPFGYFTQVRVHESKRPKPDPKVPVWKDPTPGLPDDFPRDNTKHGWDHEWWP